ncbi:MAG: nuclear transport factor 2 family protein [Caldimonas sp.]
MPQLSPNAQLVTDLFAEVAKGNGTPFWEACHDDMVWRTIGEGSWSGEFRGKQTIIDEIFRPLNRALAERSTQTTRVIDGGDIVVVQARGKNLTRKGERYDNDYAFIIHFRESKIARYEEYCDTLLIEQVLGDRKAFLGKPA